MKVLWSKYPSNFFTPPFKILRTMKDATSLEGIDKVEIGQTEIIKVKTIRIMSQTILIGSHHTKNFSKWFLFLKY